MTRPFATLLLAAALLGAPLAATGPARADDADPVLAYRAQLMKALGSHITALFAVLDGEVSYDAHLAGHAAAMAALGVMIPDVFPEGSLGGESRAKPEIWQQWDKFTAAADNLAVAAGRLEAAARAGDPAAIGAEAGAVGDACGGCHKVFRVKKD